jgi:hypothetical protein
MGSLHVLPFIIATGNAVVFPLAVVGKRRLDKMLRDMRDVNATRVVVTPSKGQIAVSLLIPTMAFVSFLPVSFSSIWAVDSTSSTWAILGSVLLAVLSIGFPLCFFLLTFGVTDLAGDEGIVRVSPFLRDVSVKWHEVTSVSHSTYEGMDIFFLHWEEKRAFNFPTDRKDSKDLLELVAQRVSIARWEPGVRESMSQALAKLGSSLKV